MFRSHLLAAAAVVVLSMTVAAYGQRGGGGGGGGGGRGGMGGGMGMMANPLNTYVTALAEANLDPDFNLTADQKKQIKTIRDDFKKATDEFNTANKDALDKARQAMRDAAGDQTAMQAARQTMTDLMAKGPKADEAVAKIKAVLTPDQATKVDTVAKEQAAARPAFGGAGGPGGGGRRGGGGGGGAGGGAGAGN